MAEWKTQVSYNYNPSYAYAYSLLYQPVTEQNHGSATGWGDHAVTDFNSCGGGAAQSLCTAVASSTAVTGEESPPRTPETETCYQGAGLVYVGDTQTGHLLMAGPPRDAYGAGGSEARRSDSEAHTSPDSWSTVSSREGSLPQVDPTNWAEKEIEEEAVIRSPNGCENVSSSLMEDSQNVQGSEASSSCVPVNAPPPAPKMVSTTTATNPKAKVRAAFTEGQMNALIQRFSVQRYLTPAEMKNLAEMTGLTYKQVKTWFQNRRMKLRRHQKDTSWVSERYAINKESSARTPVFSNMAAHIPPYQRGGHPQFPEHYNQHGMEAAFKKTPQNLAYYLAARSARYPTWSSNAPGRPHVGGWSVAPGGGHFDYNSNTFNSNSYGHTGQFENKEEPLRSSISGAVVHDGHQ